MPLHVPDMQMHDVTRLATLDANTRLPLSRASLSLLAPLRTLSLSLSWVTRHGNTCNTCNTCPSVLVALSGVVNASALFIFSWPSFLVALALKARSIRSPRHCLSRMSVYVYTSMYACMYICVCVRIYVYIIIYVNMYV